MPRLVVFWGTDLGESLHCDVTQPLQVFLLNLVHIVEFIKFDWGKGLSCDHVPFSGAQSPASLHHFNHLQNGTILITCKFAPFLSKSFFATQCNFRTLHSTWLQPMFIFTLIGFCYLVCSFDQPGVYTAIQLVGEGIGIWSVPPENFVFRKGSITKL